jgi:aspartyl-tRNA(Asn)/glutamyl-tRNA(Gln) amidotransferase subunit A
MIRAEAFAIHRVRLFEQPDRFGDDVRRRLQECESITAAEYAEHRHRARQWSRSLANTFKSFELILSPSTGTTAPSASGEMIETTRHLARLTYPWSVAGLPALSVPCGFSDEGLPIGLQLAAPRFHEKSLIRAGAAYQRLTDWHAREPPLTSQEVV